MGADTGIEAVWVQHKASYTCVSEWSDLEGSVLSPMTSLSGDITLEAVKRKLPSPGREGVFERSRRRLVAVGLTPSCKDGVRPLHILCRVGLPVPHPY